MTVSALAAALALAAPEPAGSVQAQPAPAASSAAPTEGVISYPTAFFADSQAANAWEMLLRLPGFALDTGDKIRGFEGGGGNALVDGQRPTSKTDPLDELLRRIPVAQIERIDLIRGGAPGIDMQGRTVIANVIRKPGGGLQGLVAVANNHIYDGRNLHGFRLELSGGKDGRNWEGSARYGFGADDGGDFGPGVTVGPDGAPIRVSQIDSSGGVGNQTLTGAYEQPILGGKLRVNGRLFWEKFKYEEDNVFVFPTPSLATTDDVNHTYETELGGRFTRDLGSRATLDLLGLRQTRDREISSVFASPDEDGRFNLQRDSSETIGRGVLSYRASEKLSLEAGAEGAFNKLDSQTRLMSDGVPVALPAANVLVEETRGEVFAKGVWRPTGEWTIESGLRYEASSISSSGDVALEKSLRFLKPRLALAWAPTETTQVRLRFERVVGQLSFDDFVADSSLNTGVVTAGNPDLNPEQAWVSEVAIEQRFWKDGVVGVTLRRSMLTDVIDRAPVFTDVAVFDSPANIGDGEKDELVLNLTAPLGRFGLTGAQLKGEATWRRSEVTDPTTGESREISKLRPLEWEATLSQDVPQWRLTWGVDVYGGWRETSYRFNEVSTFKLRTFVRPFVEWRARQDIIVRFELPNITERGLRRTRTVYDGPRGSSAVLFTDDRELDFGRMYFVRVRKTFGA
jgi:outer membrane receptor for ferrienterochelin and colicin